MSRIKEAAAFLSGKKTIIIALGALLYAVGIHFGWWQHSPDVDLLFGGSVAITLRLAIKNLCLALSEALEQVGPKLLLVSLLPAGLLIFSA